MPLLVLLVAMLCVGASINTGRLRRKAVRADWPHSDGLQALFAIAGVPGCINKEYAPHMLHRNLSPKLQQVVSKATAATPKTPKEPIGGQKRLKPKERKHEPPMFIVHLPPAQHPLGWNARGFPFSARCLRRSGGGSGEMGARPRQGGAGFFGQVYLC